MSNRSLPRSRRPIPGRGLAGLLYILSVVLVPVVHAQTERLAEGTAVEAHHTAQCFPIHNEALCPTCGAHRSLTARVAVAAPLANTLPGAPFTHASDVPPPAPSLSPPATRAPPAR